MACVVCNGRGKLLRDVCPLCDGVCSWPQDVDAASKAKFRPQRFTCLTYNVLLPNSLEGQPIPDGHHENLGWWIYKYYRYSGVGSNPHADWSARRDLLYSQMLPADASARYDVLCLQELNSDSRASLADFSFLSDAGYDALIHESMRGPMKPATFWRKDTWELVASKHGQRSLVVALRSCGDPTRIVFIVNAHLHAGDAGQRLQQAEGALDAVAKLARGLQVTFPGTPVVFCGDFNSQGKTAVHELLVNGSVSADFREADHQVTKSGKKNKVELFHDAADVFFQGCPPATLLLENIDSKMLAGEGSLDKRPPTEALIAALDAAFQACCSEGRTVMTSDDIDQWLIRINGLVGRGAEFHYAEKIFASHDGGRVLSRDEFHSINMDCLREGKFWEVEYDLNALGGFGLAVPHGGPCMLRMDYIYFTPSSARVVDVQQPLTAAQQQHIFSAPFDVLPNAWHPSDHLPVIATFELM